MARRIVHKRYSGYDTLPTGRATSAITSGCLCLEGGAMRGVYTSGVLDALMLEGINFECVAGVSAGALNGFQYVAGQIGRSARMNLGYRHDHRMFGVSPIVKDRSIYGFTFVFRDISKMKDMEDLDEERFFSTPQRFIVAATDCTTGKPAYFEKGKCDIFKATKASASMQYLSKMVEINGIKCLDGCASVHTPYQWAIGEGYDKVIVVRTWPRDYRKEAPSENSIADKMYRKYPEYLESLHHADLEFNEECDEMDRLEKEGRIFVISPSKELEISKLEADMEKLGEWYYLGYHDMAASLPGLYEYLGIQKGEDHEG